ncbi:hypothetical protein CYY_006100 [Polysphondylium violaceum]|uniref:Uncharacterized protein n=1 Tax=Polysphondylium violaceum TaxID=133409 RepID=A0A8J4PSF8_9MYCE|nr:hypothetical protein CYY_006100 [Polysphondylium violaceum]
MAQKLYISKDSIISHLEEYSTIEFNSEKETDAGTLLKLNINNVETSITLNPNGTILVQSKNQNQSKRIQDALNQLNILERDNNSSIGILRNKPSSNDLGSSHDVKKYKVLVIPKNSLDTIQPRLKELKVEIEYIHLNGDEKEIIDKIKEHGSGTTLVTYV